MTLELRTIYIDRVTDCAIGARAASSNLAKAEVFRRAVSLGIKRVRQAGSRPALLAPAEPLVLKTVKLETRVVDLLRAESLDRHLPTNDILREYLAAGIK